MLARCLFEHRLLLICHILNLFLNIWASVTMNFFPGFESNLEKIMQDLWRKFMWCQTWNWERRIICKTSNFVITNICPKCCRKKYTKNPHVLKIYLEKDFRPHLIRDVMRFRQLYALFWPWNFEWHDKSSGSYNSFWKIA